MSENRSISNKSLEILERNVELYDTLKEEMLNDSRNISKREYLLGEIVKINQPLIHLRASKLPYKNYSFCEFEDAVQIYSIAFMRVIEDAAKEGKDFDWVFFTVTTNLAKRMLHNTYKDNTDCGYEGTLKRVKADKRIKNVSYDAITEEAGELGEISGTSKDVLEEVIATEELKAKEDLIKKIADIISSGYLNGDELKLLNLLYAENLSVRKAAEQLCVSHTTLNKRNKALKAKIRVELECICDSEEFCLI